MNEQLEQAKKILVVDDDQEIVDLLSDWLSQRGFITETAIDAQSLSTSLENAADSYALVLLDIMLPDGDGIDLCKDISDNYPQLPVILMTANKNESDRVLGLEFGADDYLQKPFNFRELLARVKAIFRRVENSVNGCQEPQPVVERTDTETIYEFSGWKLKTGARELIDPEGLEVSLTSGVYDILLIFLEHPRRVLSRDFLMDSTQNRLLEAYDRSIDVQVSRLRQKLGDDANDAALIKTVRNGGYMFTSLVNKR